MALEPKREGFEDTRDFLIDKYGFVDPEDGPYYHSGDYFPFEVYPTEEGLIELTVNGEYEITHQTGPLTKLQFRVLYILMENFRLQNKGNEEL